MLKKLAVAVVESVQANWCTSWHENGLAGCVLVYENVVPDSVANTFGFTALGVNANAPPTPTSAAIAVRLVANFFMLKD